MKTVVMRRVICRAVLAIVFVTIVAASPANAAPPARTFVASTGNDANACSGTMPCRNFAAAITAVATGGEVVVLDSASYDPVSIPKAVSIIAPEGVYAGISVPAGKTGITVNPPAGALVVLRGLTLAAASGAGGGIGIIGSATLLIDRCHIAGPFFMGIDSSASNTQLTVRDTTVTGATNYGVHVNLAGNAVIERSLLEKAGLNGLGVTNGNVVVRDSVIKNNQRGVAASVLGRVLVENSVVTHNASGLAVFGGLIRAASTVISYNTTGLAITNGVIMSYGNNRLRDNTTNGKFSSVEALQ